MTHTPGPWEIGGASTIRTPCPNAIYIASVNAHNRAANARLIAAAPDLLAALKGMLDQPDTPDAYDAMMQRAEAAIRAVEGSEP